LQTFPAGLKAGFGNRKMKINLTQRQSIFHQVLQPPPARGQVLGLDDHAFDN